MIAGGNHTFIHWAHWCNEYHQPAGLALSAGTARKKEEAANRFLFFILLDVHRSNEPGGAPRSESRYT